MLFRAFLVAFHLHLLLSPGFAQIKISRAEELLRSAEASIIRQDFAAAESSLASARPLVKGWSLEMLLFNAYGSLRDGYAKKGLFQQAEATNLQAKAALEKVMKEAEVRPVANQLRANFLDSSAELMMQQRRFAEAKKLLDEELLLLKTPERSSDRTPANNAFLLAMMSAMIGSEDQKIAQALEKSGNVALMLQDFVEANARFREAITLTERITTSQPLSAAALHSRIGGSLLNAKQYSEATTSYLKALSLAEANLSPNHPYIAERSNALAIAYTLQGDYVQAEPLFAKAIAIYERTPDGAQSVQLTVKNYVGMLKRAGRSADGAALESRYSSPPK